MSTSKKKHKQNINVQYIGFNTFCRWVFFFLEIRLGEYLSLNSVIVLFYNNRKQ